MQRPQSLTTPQLISVIHSISLHSLASTEADAALVSSYIKNLDVSPVPGARALGSLRSRGWGVEKAERKGEEFVLLFLRQKAADTTLAALGLAVILLLHMRAGRRSCLVLHLSVSCLSLRGT